MKRRMEKKGQFYLVATVVITALIIGFVSISNYSKTTKTTTVYDLESELGIEGENLLDYGTIYDQNKTELIENFTNQFDGHIPDDLELYFLFGNETEVIVYTYKNQTTLATQKIIPSGNNIKISVHKEIYSFKLEKGENFYFVIYQDVGGETYIITNNP